MWKYESCVWYCLLERKSWWKSVNIGCRFGSCNMVNNAYYYSIVAYGGNIHDNSDILYMKAVPLNIIFFSHGGYFLIASLLRKILCGDRCFRFFIRFQQVFMIWTKIQTICDFYGRLWLLVANWLSFSMVTHGSLQGHDLVYFDNLCCFSKSVRLTLYII